MEIPTLQTDRLLLRPFSAADVDAYVELNANQEVMRYIDKVQDREAAFRSLCANIGHWHVRGYGPWAVEDRATGRLIGRATQRSTLAGCSCPQDAEQLAACPTQPRVGDGAGPPWRVCYWSAGASRTTWSRRARILAPS